MTTVNNFVDILRIIREQPEWGEALRSALLSKEVLELPQRLAEFSEAANKRFDKLEGDVGELKGGQARLEGDVAELKKGQARLEGDVAELKTGQARLEGDVAGLKTGQARLEGDVAELKEGQARLEGDVAELKTGQARLEGNVAELKTGQVRLEGDVAELKRGQARLEGAVSMLQGGFGNLRGSDYEVKVATSIGTHTRYSLNIVRVRLLKARVVSDTMPFYEIIDVAANQGIITARERTEVASTDLILRAQRDSDQSTVYVALEASVTAGDSDITRAAERSEILGRATGETSIAAVACGNQDGDRQRLARERNVTLITVLE